MYNSKTSYKILTLSGTTWQTESISTCKGIIIIFKLFLCPSVNLTGDLILATTSANGFMTTTVTSFLSSKLILRPTPQRLSRCVYDTNISFVTFYLMTANRCELFTTLCSSFSLKATYGSLTQGLTTWVKRTKWEWRSSFT